MFMLSRPSNPGSLILSKDIPYQTTLVNYQEDKLCMKIKLKH